MTWDRVVQRTGKYCSIRRMEYPEFQTGIFGRMESALFFSQIVFRNMIVPLPRSCSRSCSRRAPTVLFFLFFLTQQIGTRFFFRLRNRIICAWKQNVANYRLKGFA